VYLLGFSIGNTYIEEMIYLFKERASSSKLGIGKKMWPRKEERERGANLHNKGLPKSSKCQNDFQPSSLLYLLALIVFST
jgi:hypothetical protein